MLKKIKERKTLVDSCIIFCIKVFGAGLGFIFSILISNKYDASGVGLYYLAISVLNLLMIISKFGMENALIKYVSVLNSEKRGKAIKEIKKSSLKLVLMLSIIGTGICILFSNAICTYIFQKSSLQKILVIVVIANIPYSLAGILNSFIKGVGKTKEAMFFESALLPLFNIISLIGFIIVNKSDEVADIGYAYLISTFFLLSVVGIYEKKCLNDISYENDKLFDFNNVISTSKALLLVASTNYLLSSTDTIMLGMMRNEAEVGIYNIAYKITTLPSMLLVAINAVLGPKFSVLYGNGKNYELRKMIQRSSKVMLGIALLLSLLFMISAEWIVMLFGNSFAGVELIIYVVTIGQFFLLATGPVATLLMMTGHEKLHRNNTIACAILNIILNLVLIYKFGALGAAIATSVSIIVKNIVGVIIVYRKMGIYIYGRC